MDRLASVIDILLAAEGSSNNGGSGWFSLLFFGAIFAAMYFLLLRPQRRRVKAAQQLQSALAEGDEVLLTSGIYGYISLIEGDVIWVEITEVGNKDKVEIRVARSAIAKKIDAGATDQGTGTSK
jgi:preprotein translocase subunit YajC